MLYALWVCCFCLNFYRLSLHLNFWYKIYLMMHYGCASFEFFFETSNYSFSQDFHISTEKMVCTQYFPGELFMSLCALHWQFSLLFSSQQLCSGTVAVSSTVTMDWKRRTSLRARLNPATLTEPMFRSLHVNAKKP